MNIESIATELLRVRIHILKIMSLSSGNSLWARLGSDVYEDGRSSLQYRRESQELCCYLLGGYHKSARFQ